MARQSWLDASGQTPVIDQYAQKLESFTAAIADGVITDEELSDQEARVAALMKKLEPKLDDALHAEVTQLLCELTALDLMQVIRTMAAQRPITKLNL